jgi:hypothetical protein
VSVSRDAAAVPTLRELKQQKHAEREAEAHEDPLVRAILAAFPGAEVRVRPPALEDIPIEAYMDAVRDEDEED